MFNSTAPITFSSSGFSSISITNGLRSSSQQFTGISINRTTSVLQTEYHQIQSSTHLRSSFDSKSITSKSLTFTRSVAETISSYTSHLQHPLQFRRSTQAIYNPFGDFFTCTHMGIIIYTGAEFKLLDVFYWTMAGTYWTWILDVYWAWTMDRTVGYLFAGPVLDLTEKWTARVGELLCIYS